MLGAVENGLRKLRKIPVVALTDTTYCIQFNSLRLSDAYIRQ